MHANPRELNLIRASQFGSYLPWKVSVVQFLVLLIFQINYKYIGKVIIWTLGQTFIICWITLPWTEFFSDWQSEKNKYKIPRARLIVIFWYIDKL